MLYTQFTPRENALSSGEWSSPFSCSTKLILIIWFWKKKLGKILRHSFPTANFGSNNFVPSKEKHDFAGCPVAPF